MRTLARRITAILLLTACACASPNAPHQQWLEVRSANFSIYTTLAERGARNLLEDLELFRAAVLQVTKVGSVQPHVPTEIYAFRTDAEYRPFQPRPDTAGFFRPTLRMNFMVLLAGAHSKQARARSTLYHEYTHFLIQNEGHLHYPLWFEEGFAELLGAVDVRGDTVRIGVVPPHLVNWIRYGTQMPYSRVIRSRSYDGWNPDELQMLYAQSWLLVHYLTLGSDGDVTPRLRHYVERLEGHATEEQAFREAFGIEVNDLSPRLKRYQAKVPTFGMARDKLTPDLATAVRPVPPDEIDTRLGWLAQAGGASDLALEYFERATAANPTNARAIAGIAEVHKTRHRFEDAEAGYERALALAPDDWRNHLELAEYLIDRASTGDAQPEKRLELAREHLTRAIVLAPDIPEGHAMLGLAYGMRSDTLEWGIASLERALALLPSHPQIEYPLAQLHASAGHRDRAIELLRRIVYKPHWEASPEAMEMLEKLERDADATPHD